MRFLLLIIFSCLCIFSSAGEHEGKWIAPEEISTPNTWMTFRKDFTLRKTPSEATAKIAADSKYWLWVNGRLAVFEGGLKRGPNPKDTYYDEVDLAPYLKKGKNSIALLVWYFGKDGFSHKNSGKAGLLFELQTPQGMVASDETWLSRIHPAYQDTDSPHPNFRLAESNIRFDARNDIKGWQTSDSPEKAGFRQSVVVARKGDAPYNRLVLRPIPQWKDFGMAEFEKVETLTGEKQDTLAAYLPYNLQMTPYLDVTDHTGGSMISIYTDNTYAAGDINLRAEYITSKGRQQYESLGWLNGHMVFFVIPKGVEVHGIGYRQTGFDTELSGSFSCSDEFVNRYWEKSLRTLYVNMRDTYFDCPERERAQWWGDVVLLMGESFYTCSESVQSLMKKGINELIDWQKPDGSLFSPVPAGNYDSELPGQMLAAIGWYGFWNYYMNTGDKATIEHAYPGVRRYLELWALDETGLTGFRSGGWTWGDWGDNRDIRLIFAGWHYLALKGAESMATLLGKEDDAAGYRSIMARIKEGYNRCWNGTAYRHPEYREQTDDRVQALAVISGIADEEKYPAITELLKTEFHASPYMERYVAEALFIMGEGKYAIERMTERYGPMVNHPFYTTLFEGWDIGENGFGGGTVNHAWSGGCIISIAQHICGIVPTTPGWKTFDIKPDCSVFEEADIVVPTRYGKIHSSFKADDVGVVMEVTIPEGTRADVSVPSVPGKKPSAVYINGVQQEDKEAYTLEAGTYTLERKITPRFEIGRNTFLLDGKPFVVKAAELHYPRIPKEYWEHRILMCKALGMNTICMYIFWNYHEMKEGEFSFSDEKDIAEFCRLAQKHGMYVIVRPGPYVCAEWEMGGLPWWLLKKDDIKLRTLDPYYMKHVTGFLKEVGKELAPLQISRGGNIIMVQVENEYGSYGIDKPYITAVRDALVSAGFTDVPLFQCDWSSNFTDNALDDLLWTINFGTGADIGQQFRRLKELRPDTPLMCSEYWSGWFDHWGRKHETRPAGAMVEGIREMLENNISFSLYMTHGGTTFGHWGGANNPPFSAMCSSYDYDAPISESGLVTEKYILLRNLLSEYAGAAELTEIPPAYPVITIPEIVFKESAALYDNLPECHETEETRPMEFFDQGWGTILYRHRTGHDIPAGTILKVTEIHDWGQIFIDGKPIAVYDRRKDNPDTVLPAIRKGTELDILIEAMGRVNFDKSIHDRKGITEKVELLYDGKTETLKDWKVYSFPVDYEYVRNQKYRKSGTVCHKPAYWHSTFTLDETGDTFLDMSTWGKGMVWVNGHALGRFWEIGPQQTLYLPGCWLNKGKNDIYVLDLSGCRKPVVRGLAEPILDSLGTAGMKADERIIDLSKEKPVCEQKFAFKGGWQEIRFAQPSKGRYFCIEALSPQHDGDKVSVAEIEILGENGQPVSRENWKIAYVDSEDMENGNYGGEKIFDLQESTYWSTVPGTDYPHRIVIELESDITITGFRYLPRAESTCPGMIRDFKVYIRQYDFPYIEK